MLIPALLAVIVAALAIGQYSLAPGKVLSTLLAPFAQTSEPASDASIVVWNLRLPRIAAGLLVGAALAAAGTAYQGMFRNPLVSPDILGVSAGAGLGQAWPFCWGCRFLSSRAWLLLVG